MQAAREQMNEKWGESSCGTLQAVVLVQTEMESTWHMQAAGGQMNDKWGESRCDDPSVVCCRLLFWTDWDGEYLVYTGSRWRDQ